MYKFAERSLQNDYSRTLAKDHLDQETTLLLKPLFPSPDDFSYVIQLNSTKTMTFKLRKL